MVVSSVVVDCRKPRRRILPRSSPDPPIFRVIRKADDTGAGRPYRYGMSLRRVHLDAATVDRLLAVILFVFYELQVLLSPTVEPTRPVAAVVGGLVTAGLAVRRRYPAAVGIGTQGLLAVTINFGNIPAGPVTVAWFCALYAMAVWTGRLWFVVGVVFFAVSDLWTWPLDHEIPSGTLDFTAAVVLTMVLLRIVVGGRDRRLAVAQRERDVAAREAVVEERVRIARELHDVIAHHVSTMVVQAGAERRLLDADQAETREVLGTIERVGRSALGEMRRMVAVLRQGQAEDLTPQPTLSDVPELVAQMREAGLDVELTTSGEPRELPVGLQLSAYRIVQEALTNAFKHAGSARVLVEISHTPDALGLVVRDDGQGATAAAPGAGHGLVGMRERVAMYGGRIETGRQPDGGFGVRVLLPAR
jgi:signal transduction histidine kinase